MRYEVWSGTRCKKLFETNSYKLACSMAFMFIDMEVAGGRNEDDVNIGVCDTESSTPQRFVSMIVQ